MELRHTVHRKGGELEIVRSPQRWSLSLAKGGKYLADTLSKPTAVTAEVRCRQHADWRSYSARHVKRKGEAPLVLSGFRI